MSTAFDLADLRARVQAQIVDELARQRGVLTELGPDMCPLVDEITSLLAGGKRFRAAFCYYGYAAGGGRHLEAILRAATAMELFQAAALLHDDVMDDSATRRGRPSAHRNLAAVHARSAWRGDSDRFGISGAILAGNLCLVWTDEMVAGSGLPVDELARARVIFDRMRTQLMGGQFLDILSAARGWDALTTPERVAQARQVVRYKSAKYSIEQPLLIGAHAAGVDGDDAARLSTYGVALGEAFQLRDDVLGVFGDPHETGKPAGDDLREGKRTVLLALVLDQLAEADARTLTDRLGRLDLTTADIEELRTMIRGSGGLERHEELIAELTATAREALDSTVHLSDDGKAALGQLVDVATARTS